MKLRIRGNSIRLRLSQSEVDSLAGQGSVSELTEFPNSRSLEYKVVTGESFDAEFINDVVLITVHGSQIPAWSSSDQVSLMGELDLQKGGILSILVEKDFKCLTVRPEDESDLFTNPNESHC